MYKSILKLTLLDKEDNKLTEDQIKKEIDESLDILRNSMFSELIPILNSNHKNKPLSSESSGISQVEGAGSESDKRSCNNSEYDNNLSPRSATNLTSPALDAKQRFEDYLSEDMEQDDETSESEDSVWDEDVMIRRTGV